MTILEAIESRVSDRTFTGPCLDAKLRFRLSETLSVKGPFGTCPRTVLFDAASVSGDGGADGGSKGARIGTYGIVKNPAAYLAAIVRGGKDVAMDGREADRLLFDLGYVVEGFVLEATRLGLGTCWLGGTFDKGGAAVAAGVASGEALRALIAVGTPAARRAFMDRFIRSAAGSAGRLPMGELARGTEAALLEEPALARLAEAVRRAPSASNKQPWRLALARDEGGAVLFDLSLARDPRYERLAGYGIQSVDCGIAARHVEAAAFELGFLPERRFRAMEGSPVGKDAGFVIGWRLFRR